MATATRKKSQQSQPARHVRPLFLPPTMEAAVTIREICAASKMGRAKLESLIKSGEFPAPDFKLDPNDKKRRWTVELFNHWFATKVQRNQNGSN